MAEDLITSIETTHVRVPLPRPLQLGRLTITEREYAVVRVSTCDGLEGYAYSLTRSAPVAATMARQVASTAVGMPADRIAAVGEAVMRANITSDRAGGFMRAFSLLDIALWDVKGKRAKLPVWRLLGGHAAETPCMLVGAYPTGEPPGVIGERVASFAHAGHQLIKFARITPAKALKQLLTIAARDVPAETRFVVDAAWCWTRSEEARAEMDEWGSAAPLAWVEDPLAPEDVAGYADLCAGAPVPIGVGDDLTDPHVAYRLMSEAKIDVLRIDATTVGGISSAWQLSHVAQALQVPVSFHIYPETHVHIAAAGAARGLTETFGAASDQLDPAPRLYGGGPRFEPGLAVASEEPGLGIDLDTEFVEAHRVGDEAVGASSRTTS